jgi:hypothetical protein
MDETFLDMSEDDQRRIADRLWELAKRDEESTGDYYEGDLEGVGHCRAYKSPDGKVLRFTVNEEGPFQVLSGGAAFGYSLGDAAPEWALEDD